jgi:steroid delta-isomerase-like uncharacterized protein
MHRRQLLQAAALAALLPVAPVHAQDSPQSVVEAYVAAWNAHDSARAASYFADDVTYYDASVGTPAEGREAATAVIDGFLTAAPDAAWTMTGAPLVQDDRVAFEWEFKGTNTGPWGDGTAATGKPFAFTGASVFTVQDGKITSQADYYDALGFYKQLGLM